MMKAFQKIILGLEVLRGRNYQTDDISMRIWKFIDGQGALLLNIHTAKKLHLK